MADYKNTDFTKRILVKGYPRKDVYGNVHMVSPHYRVIKTVKTSKLDNSLLKRRRLV